MRVRLAGWVCVVCCLAAGSLMFTSPAGAVAGYGDVAEDSYYAKAVQWSVDNNITDIDGDCFSPNTPVSRGEAAVFVWKMQGQRTAAAHSFTDVTIDSQNAAISWMSATNITTGTSATTFSPETTTTRAQAAAFLHRLADEPAASPHPFTDVVAGWQQGPVSWMAATGITTGTSATKFSPDSTLTRAQLITFLYRYKGEPDITVDAATPTCGPVLLLPDDLDAKDLPPALITLAGIPVALLGHADGGFLVRTPCGATATVSAGWTIDEARVVIDPGHGGSYDVGAVGANGLTERDLNLTLSHAVLKELSARGIAAATTRTGNYGSLLSVRSAFADALGADALVSIHHNGPTWRTGNVPGTEVFVQSASTQQARATSARLGGLLYDEITAALGDFDGIAWSRLPDAGVLRVLLPSGGDAYGMIRHPAVPAVLVEYGYLSNPSEANLFATDEYIQTAAIATANAIEAYLLTDRPGAELVSRPRVFDPALAPTRCNEVALE